MNGTETILRVDSKSGWDEWVESLSRNCGLGCSSAALTAQASRTESWSAGDLKIIDLDIADQNWSSINDDDHRWVEDMIAMKTITQGSLVIEQGGIDRRFEPGSFILIDPARRLTEHFARRVRVSVVLIPKRLLRSRGLVDTLPGLMVPDVTIPDVAAVRDFALCLAQQAGSTSCEIRQRSSEYLLSLMELLFAHPDYYNRGRSNSAILARAKQVIGARFAEIDLCPKRIAEELHISVGHLNRVFKMDNTSVMRHVWTLRVEHAARLLGRVATRRIQIQEIAYQCGFSSAAHFSRVFKERFGTPPRDMHEYEQSA
jgi:AraC-like DNA-binding protein